MSKVKIIIEGYAREEGDAIVATCSTVLIEDSGKKIIVDPGINKNLLLRKLKENGLAVKDFDIVFMTHYHPDHILNVGLFEKSQIMDGDTIYSEDVETFYEKKIPGTEIEVLETPGHASEHASPVVKTDDGIVVVAQDVFWWMDGEQDTSSREALIELEDPFGKDMDELKKSREKVLKIADWIIPGHGKMFENEFKK